MTSLMKYFVCFDALWGEIYRPECRMTSQTAAYRFFFTIFCDSFYQLNAKHFFQLNHFRVQEKFGKVRIVFRTKQCV